MDNVLSFKYQSNETLGGGMDLSCSDKMLGWATLTGIFLAHAVLFILAAVYPAIHVFSLFSSEKRLEWSFDPTT